MRASVVTVAAAMSHLRRWLASGLVALALLPGLERSLLAHDHASPGSVTQLSGTPHAGAAGLNGCAVCQARASLGSLAIDRHPERHGAAPVSPPLSLREPAPAAPRLETPHVRGPPLRIV